MYEFDRIENGVVVGKVLGTISYIKLLAMSRYENSTFVNKTEIGGAVRTITITADYITTSLQ